MAFSSSFVIAVIVAPKTRIYRRDPWNIERK
jgi:hypothetical protein